jgi:hypothetical protein
MSERDLLHTERARISGVLESCEFVFKDEPGWTPPDDTGYLTEADRANPDIMANVEAIAAVSQQIDWLGSDDTGHIGIWRASGHVVRLDTEGQYGVRACDVGDYLARAVREEEFDAARDELIAAGFRVSATIGAIYASIARAPDIAALHRELDKEARARRGLPPPGR